MLKMADLIFVSTEEFKRLQDLKVGIYIEDNQKVPMILLDYFIIKISDINEDGSYK